MWTIHSYSNVPPVEFTSASPERHISLVANEKIVTGFRPSTCLMTGSWPTRPNSCTRLIAAEKTSHKINKIIGKSPNQLSTIERRLTSFQNKAGICATLSDHLSKDLLDGITSIMINVCKQSPSHCICQQVNVKTSWYIHLRKSVKYWEKEVCLHSYIIQTDIHTSLWVWILCLIIKFQNSIV